MDQKTTNLIKLSSIHHPSLDKIAAVDQIFGEYVNQVKDILWIVERPQLEEEFTAIISPHQWVEVPLLLIGEKSVGKTTMMNYMLSI